MQIETEKDQTQAKEKIYAAQKEYAEIADRLKPFLKKREKSKTHSTSGKWVACE